MKKILLLIFLFLLCVNSWAQNGAYIIPRRIFVGDPAVLILPLPAAAQEAADIILTASSYNFPSHADIDFHRIILERRIAGSRLRIEFTAFVPGLLEFPDIEIGGEKYSGLSVTINSVIDNRSPLMLSGPASSLAMPGTALLLYGALAGLIFFILFTIWLVLKGRKLIKTWLDKIKRWRTFTSMKLMEKRLRRSVVKGENKRLILDRLSLELRVHLSMLTGKNCRSMTSFEFEKLSILLLLNEINLSFFGKFFQSCDELRFGGGNIKQKDLLNLLADLRNFLNILENNTLKRTKKEKEGKAA